MRGIRGNHFQRRAANTGTVLGEHPRAFKRVFALAQEQLRRLFGMEMRQLPVREKLTLEEKRKGEMDMLDIHCN